MAYDMDRHTGLISLGRQLESGVTTLAFDAADWLVLWPNATITVTFKLPGGSILPLPSSQYVVNEGELRVAVLSNMTATPGMGSLNIRFVEGPAHRRTFVYDTWTEASHDSGDVMPDLVQDWVDEATLKWGSVDATVTALASEADPTVTVEQDKDGTHFAFGAVPGKSAYEQAVDGGYGKSEAEFIADLDEFEGLVDAVDAAELAQTAAESARDLASGYAATASTKADAAEAARDLAEGYAAQLAAAIINVKSYGAVGDGETDDTAAIEACITAAPEGSTILFPNATYYIATEITVSKNLNMDFDGSTILCGAARGITFTGTLKSTKTVTADYVETTSKNALVLSDVTGILVGDLLNIKSTELYDTSRLYYYKGGNCIVTGISGSTVYTSMSFPFDMDAATITVNVYTPVKCKVLNIGLMEGQLPIASSTYGLTIEYGTDVVIENCEFDNFQTNLEVKRCVNTRISNVRTGHAKNTTGDGWDGYGVMIFSCTMCTLDHVYTNSGQHGVTWGGQEVNYGIRFDNCTIKAEVWDLGLGMHENIFDLTVNNCILHGASFAGNTIIRNTMIVKNELSVHANIYMACAESSRYASYLFENCSFVGYTQAPVILRDHYQVVCPTRKYVGRIKFDRCTKFFLGLSVTNYSSGVKVAEVESLEIVGCRDFVVSMYDILGQLVIENSSSTIDSNIIAQAAYEAAYQPIGRVVIREVTLPIRANAIRMNNVGYLLIDGLYNNTTDYGNHRYILSGIDKANIKRMYIPSDAAYGLSLTDIGDLYLEQCEIRTISTGLDTQLLNATNLRGHMVYDSRASTMYDYETATDGTFWKIKTDIDGTRLATKLVLT